MSPLYEVNYSEIAFPLPTEAELAKCGASENMLLLKLKNKRN
jgi:hypothetical protein